MEFFGVGIGAGIGIGIAIGMSAGAKQAREKLCHYFRDQRLTLSDAQGKSLEMDPVLDQVLGSDRPSRRTLAIVLTLIGLLTAMALVGTLVYMATAR